MSVKPLLLTARLTGNSSDVWQLVSVLLIFCFILALTYFVTKWIAKVSQGSSAATNIAVIETAKIAQNKYVQILRIGRRYFVVSVCKDQMSLISEIQEEDMLTAQINTAAESPFARILKNVSENLPFHKKNDMRDEECKGELGSSVDAKKAGADENSD